MGISTCLEGLHDVMSVDSSTSCFLDISCRVPAVSIRGLLGLQACLNRVRPTHLSISGPRLSPPSLYLLLLWAPAFYLHLPPYAPA